MDKILTTDVYNEDVIFDTPMRHSDGHTWSHLVAKDIDTLHDFAERLGFKKEWFQISVNGTPHYDIKTNSKRKLALLMGAVQVTRRYLFNYAVINYKLNIKLVRQD